MKNNIYQSFVDNLKIEEQDMLKVMGSFVKYLGFEDFEISEFLIGPNGDLLTTEVLGFDDRRIFITVFENKDSITGRYVITDKNADVLDVITFKQDNDKWSEID